MKLDTVRDISEADGPFVTVYLEGRGEPDPAEVERTA